MDPIYAECNKKKTKSKIDGEKHKIRKQQQAAGTLPYYAQAGLYAKPTEINLPSFVHGNVSKETYSGWTLALIFCLQTAFPKWIYAPIFSTRIQFFHGSNPSFGSMVHDYAFDFSIIKTV